MWSDARGVTPEAVGAANRERRKSVKKDILNIEDPGWIAWTVYRPMPGEKDDFVLVSLPSRPRQDDEIISAFDDPNCAVLLELSEDKNVTKDPEDEEL